VFEGFNDEARAALYCAQAGSRRMGTIDAGPEHVLLGMMAVDSEASTALAGLGVAASEVERVVALRGRPAIAEDASVRWTSQCRAMFEACLGSRLDRGGGPIGVEELAVALTFARYGEATTIIADLSGLEMAAVRALLMERFGIAQWNQTEASRAGRFDLGRRGSVDPDEAALGGFCPQDGAYVADVCYANRGHAVVQVGFPDKAAFYWLNVYRHQDGWLVERPQ
jgi:hypothetical protein